MINKVIRMIIMIIASVSLLNCGGLDSDKYYTIDNVYTDVHITSVSVAKYSKIEGYIYYKGIKIDIDNGNKGYHYKEYSLTPMNVINRKVIVYIRNVRSSNPYRRNIEISTGAVDFSDYEIQK